MRAEILAVPEGMPVYSADHVPLGTLRCCGLDALLLQRGRLATGYWYLPSWSLDCVDEAGVHLKLTKRAAEAIAQQEWPPVKQPQARYWPCYRYKTGHMAQAIPA